MGGIAIPPMPPGLTAGESKEPDSVATLASSQACVLICTILAVMCAGSLSTRSLTPSNGGALTTSAFVRHKDELKVPCAHCQQYLVRNLHTKYKA